MNRTQQFALSITVLTIALVFWITTPQAHAEIYYQPLGIYEEGVGAFGGLPANFPVWTGSYENVGARNYFPLGTGLSGEPAALKMRIDTLLTSPPQNFKVYIVESTSAATSTVTGNYVAFSFVADTATPAEQLSSNMTFGGAWNNSSSFDPTKYYGMIYVQGVSQSISVWGTNGGSFGYLCYSTGFSCNALFKAPFYYLYTGDSDPADAGTRFESFTPVLGLGLDHPYATSSAFAFGATGYITSNDIDDDQYLYIRWRNMSGGIGTACPLGSEWGEFTIPIGTTTNVFSVSTTKSIPCFGSYAAYYAIKKPGPGLFGYTLWDTVVIDAIGSFVVGTSTGGYLPPVTDVYSTDLAIGTGLSGTPFANASSTLIDFTGFLDMRTQMAGKFPISWAIETVAVVVEAVSTYSTSTRPASTTIDFGNMQTLQWVSTTTSHDLEVPLWSWGWIDRVAAIPQWQSLIAITVGLIYLGLGAFAISEGRRMFRELQG